MKTSAIRSLFLNYFKKNGHVIIESSSLVPQNDPTLLFTNAGMVQFKDVFLGKDRRLYTRATTSQKCVRAGGKHNDLENVGFTARHHTFFEMLGNFSFGDYFKKEAIHYAWEFVTQELQLPREKLYVSVFEKDNEAAEIWEKQERIPKERIYRFGEKDNFWAMGDTGPCGPCSELFIDRGEKYGCGKSTCAVGCSCDRFMEFWNLVFMQFERGADGALTPLPKPSVDTGAGLERLASILQKVDSNYDTDLFRDIIIKTEEILGQKYDPTSGLAISFRVIADHARAAAFLIGDGILPSNEGRGYVLRRIMRRAIRHGRKLGFQEPFFFKTSQFVIDQMKDAYPDLQDKRAFIAKAIQAEEEQFLKTLARGLDLLEEETSRLGSSKILPGEVAFKLYDTYGFPLDLTRVICSEKQLVVDEPGFEKAMDRQRTESRKHWKGSGEAAVSAVYLQLASELKEKKQLPKFIGYEKIRGRGKCLALLVVEDSGLKRVEEFTVPPLALSTDSPEKNVILEAVFSETPFYGESGGQIGDRGRVFGGKEDFEGEVFDVQKPTPDLIVTHIQTKKGTLRVGEEYEQETHQEIRALTARNHTATHLLHWALRKVLGPHVKQAGSLVSPDLLRFDFTHFQALSDEEFKKVETLVNDKIWNAEKVSKQVMPKEKAMEAGAIAFFGEKYGNEVRVVSIGDFSTELCGGTHVDNSSEIHLFKIASESGIAAGVRRMVAYTSKGAYTYLNLREGELKRVQERLRASTPNEIFGKIEKILSTEKDLRRQLELIQSKSAGTEVNEILSHAEPISGGRRIVALCNPHPEGIKRLREISDRIKQKAEDAVIVLGMKEAETNKASLLIAVGPKAPSQWNANALIKELAPLIEGKGGGKPDLAQAGGSNLQGLDQALLAAQKKLMESKQ